MSKEALAPTPVDLRAHPIVASYADLYATHAAGGELPTSFERARFCEAGDQTSIDSIIRDLACAMEQQHAARGVVLVSGLPSTRKSHTVDPLKAAWKKTSGSDALHLATDDFLATERGSDARASMHDTLRHFREGYASRALDEVFQKMIVAKAGAVVTQTGIYNRASGGKLDGEGRWHIPKANRSLLIVEGTASALLFAHPSLRDMPTTRVVILDDIATSLLNVCFRDAKTFGAEKEKPTDERLAARFIERMQDAIYLMDLLDRAMRHADVVLVHAAGGHTNALKKYGKAQHAYPAVISLISQAVTEAMRDFIPRQKSKTRREIAATVGQQLLTRLTLLPHAPSA